MRPRGVVSMHRGGTVSRARNKGVNEVCNPFDTQRRKSIGIRTMIHRSYVRSCLDIQAGLVCEHHTAPDVERPATSYDAIGEISWISSPVSVAQLYS